LKLTADYLCKKLNIGGRLVWKTDYLRKDSKVRKGKSLSKGSSGIIQQLKSSKVMNGGKDYLVKI